MAEEYCWAITQDGADGHAAANQVPVVYSLVFNRNPMYRVIQNDCRGIVYSCTDGSRNSQSFLL